MSYRVCKTCGEAFLLSDEFYYRKSDRPNLFLTSCKECVKQQERQRWNKNHEAEQKQRQLYYEVDRNPATGLLLCRKCGAKKPVDDFYKCSRFKSGYQTWCKRCMITYSKVHHAEKREYYQRLQKNRNQEARMRVLVHYGGDPPKCKCCRENRYEFLAIDHIHGGGRKHRRKVGSGHAFYKHLIDNGFPEGYRILCHNCNQSLGQYGYCPHEREKGDACRLTPTTT